MIKFKPEYDSYQDVKSTLAGWSIFPWAAVLLALYFAVLTKEHRDAVLQAIPGLPDWITKAGIIPVVVILGSGMAYVTTHLFELHSFYDRHVVKWRHRYTREKMIPALIEPYRDKLPDNVSELLGQKPEVALRSLFYPFASDRDMKIRANLVVRFYERITKYWLCQIVEVACVSLVCLIIIYLSLINEYTPRTRVAWTLLGASAIAVFARLVALHLRRAVWDATKEEIQDIHGSHAVEFEKALIKHCGSHGITIQNQIITP